MLPPCSAGICLPSNGSSPAPCRNQGERRRAGREGAELRHALNYGHTIGHALEAVTGYSRWAHGEAVSLGIVAEARLAERLGIAEAPTTERQVRLLRAVGLPVSGLGAAPSAVVEAPGA